MYVTQCSYLVGLFSQIEHNTVLTNFHELTQFMSVISRDGQYSTRKISTGIHSELALVLSTVARPRV